MNKNTDGDGFTRRDLLTRASGLAVGLAVGGTSLAEAGSAFARPLAHGVADAARLGHATLAFSWLENVQQAGSYIAQKRGYYRAAGLDVSFLPGGITYAGEPLVVSGKALLAMTSPTTTAAAVDKGAALAIVAAQYQKSPVAMISLAKNPIRTPKDLAGKTIGVQPNIAVEWRAFQKVNGIVGKAKTLITTQDVSILTGGQVDGFIGWATNDGVALKVKKVPAVMMLFADWGLPGFYLTYVANKKTLADKAGRAQIKAMLTGEIRGWQVQTAHPQIGLDLTMAEYGKQLGLKKNQQRIQAREQNKLIVSSDTRRHGLFWMTPKLIAATAHTLSLSGTKVPKNLFDNSVLQEIYHGRSHLS